MSLGIGGAVKQAAVSAARYFTGIKNAIFPEIEGSMGASDIKLMGNFLYEEYQADLKYYRSRYALFNEMRKSEPAIHLPLLCYEYPVLSATIDFALENQDENSEDIDDDRGEEILDLVKTNLLRNWRRPWAAILEEILTFLQYGVSVFEIIWEQRDGQWFVVDLEYRHPRSILWQFDNQNNLIGIKQWVQWGNKSTQGDKMIPIEKLLIFTNDRIAENFEGVGFCRYCYKEWKMKMKMINLLMVGFERFLVKMPLFKQPGRASATDEERMKNIIKLWRSYEKAGGTLPPGYEWVDVSDSFTGVGAALQFVDKLEKGMVMSMMAQFILLGQGGVGSYALSKDQSDFFSMALSAIMRIITDTFNFSLIPKIVDYNFPDTIYPKMSMTISNEDTQSIIDNIIKLNGAGLIPTYKELQEKLIKMVKAPEVDLDELAAEKEMQMPEAPPLPPMPEDDQRINDAAKQGLTVGELNKIAKQDGQVPGQNEPPQEEPATMSECGPGGQGGHFHPWRELTATEEKHGGIALLKEKDSINRKATESLRAKLMPLMQRMRMEYQKAVEGKTLQEALKTEVPRGEEYRKLCEEYLRDSYITGMKMTEKGYNGDRKLSPKMEQNAATWAEQKSYVMASDGQQKVRSFVLQQGTQNFPPEVKEAAEKNLVNRTLGLARDMFKNLGKEI